MRKKVKIRKWFKFKNTLISLEGSTSLIHPKFRFICGTRYSTWKDTCLPMISLRRNSRDSHAINSSGELLPRPNLGAFKFESVSWSVAPVELLKVKVSPLETDLTNANTGEELIRKDGGGEHESQCYRFMHNNNGGVSVSMRSKKHSSATKEKKKKKSQKKKSFCVKLLNWHL